MSVTTWQGCYDDSWRDLIVDKSVAHPAKFAHGLIRRIFQHGLDQGWWSKGSLIGDCFGGIGTGGVIAEAMGLRWIGVELEPRFVRMAAGYDCPGMSKPEWVRWWGRYERNPDLCPQCQLGFGRQVDRPLLSDGDGHYYGDGVVPWGAPHHYAGNGVNVIQGDSRDFARLVGAVDSIVTSPPFVDSLSTGPHLQEYKFNPDTGMAKDKHRDFDYGHTPGQIGAMKPGKLDAVVTSPPYEGIVQTGGTKGLKEHGTGLTQGERAFTKYGDTAGNLGNASGDTYWEAVAAVYEQCRLALKPGGMLVVVVKDYIKAGAKVPLCDQTAALLESIGFEVVERIRASRVAESVSRGLWGEDVVERKERKSFFRRLAEAKGSPPIDWEEVICVRTTAGDETDEGPRR